MVRTQPNKGVINYNYKTSISDVGYHKVVSDKAAEYTKLNGCVLEIGSGSGNLLNMLSNKRQDLNLTATDVSQNYLSHIHHKMPDVNTFLIKDDSQLNSINSRYDTIIMSHSLEHMKNPPEIIKIALRLIKDNGHLILAVPNPVRPNVFFNNIFKRHYVPKGHVYAWDRSHWINFLEQILHLNVVEYPTDEVRFLPKQLLRRFELARQLEWTLAKFIPWWSFSNMAIIQK